MVFRVCVLARCGVDVFDAGKIVSPRAGAFAHVSCIRQRHVGVETLTISRSYRIETPRVVCTGESLW